MLVNNGDSEQLNMIRGKREAKQAFNMTKRNTCNGISDSVSEKSTSDMKRGEDEVGREVPLDANLPWPRLLLQF